MKTNLKKLGLCQKILKGALFFFFLKGIYELLKQHQILCQQHAEVLGGIFSTPLQENFL